MDLVEPAEQVRVLDLQDPVEDLEPEEHLAHGEEVGDGEAVPDQEPPVLEVAVQALAAGVEASQAILAVFAHGLVAADQRQDHAAD